MSRVLTRSYLTKPRLVLKTSGGKERGEETSGLVQLVFLMGELVFLVKTNNLLKNRSHNYAFFGHTRLVLSPLYPSWGAWGDWLNLVDSVLVFFEKQIKSWRHGENKLNRDVIEWIRTGLKNGTITIENFTSYFCVLPKLHLMFINVRAVQRQIKVELFFLDNMSLFYSAILDFKHFCRFTNNYCKR